MKKVLAVLAVSMLATSAFAASDSGVVTFRGSFIQDSCQVDSNSKNVAVKFDDVHTANARVTGAVPNSEKPFSISLMNCPANYDNGTKVLSNVAIKFDNAANISQNGNLENNPGASALPVQGVEVQILGSDDQAIDLKNKPESAQASLHAMADGSAKFDFKAQYYIPDPNKVVPGSFVSSIPFVLEYK